MIDFLTKKGVAETLQISLRTVEKWMAAGILPYSKIGNVVRFDREKVEATVRSFAIHSRIHRKEQKNS